jgi:hypothetical protein
MLAVGVVIALLAAVLSAYRVSGSSLKPRQITYSAASTQILIDTPQSSLADVGQNIDPLQIRATVLANLMASPSFLKLVGERVGLSGAQIYAAGPVDPQLPRTQQEPTDLKRNVELTGETVPYKLNFNSDPNLPEIGVYAQAPTTAMAVALANASASALSQYISAAGGQTDVPDRSRATIRQLGSATGAVVNGGVGKQIMVLVFIAVLFFWCILVLAVVRFRANWRASAAVATAMASTSNAEPASQDDDGVRSPSENHDWEGVHESYFAGMSGQLER